MCQRKRLKHVTLISQITVTASGFHLGAISKDIGGANIGLWCACHRLVKTETILS